MLKYAVWVSDIKGAGENDEGLCYSQGGKDIFLCDTQKTADEHMQYLQDMFSGVTAKYKVVRITEA